MPKDKDDIMHAAGFLSAREAAELTSVALATIHRWANEGELEHSHIGNRLYVSRASLATRVGPIVAKALGLSSHSSKQS